MKINFDAPVLAAAFAGRGLCADLVALVLSRHQVVLSESLIEDLATFLNEKLKLPVEITSQVLDLLAASTETETDDQEIIVTVDEDLLAMGDYEGIPILSPPMLWQKMAEC